MLSEPKPMREIHEIQEKIYEEQKSLSIKEKVETVHREAEESLKKWGFNPRKMATISGVRKRFDKIL